MEGRMKGVEEYVGALKLGLCMSKLYIDGQCGRAV
jgi:hypothetical protein